MFIANNKSGRIGAATAERGDEFHCPECKGLVILKRGRKVVAHFAHKPPTDCTWAKGETRAHIQSKITVADVVRKRGLKAEIEFVIHTFAGDRRADVMVWSPAGAMIAFELQHCSIGLDDIERRSYSYAQSGIAQIWIPFIRDLIWRKGHKTTDGGWFVEEYPARPFEKWVHGFNAKDGMWMYDPRHNEFRLARLSSRQIYVDETSWYDENAEEQYSGGYFRFSKRFRTLKLSKAYQPQDLLILPKRRKEFKSKGYNWPAGWRAVLQPENDMGVTPAGR